MDKRERIQQVVGKLVERQGLRGASRLLGVNASTVSNWQQGIHLPDRTNLESIAKVTGHSISYLLCLNEDEGISKARDLIKTSDNIGGLMLLCNEASSRILELKALESGGTYSF